MDQNNVSSEPIREPGLSDNCPACLHGRGSRQHCRGRIGDQVFNLCSSPQNWTNSFVNGLSYLRPSLWFSLRNPYIVSMIASMLAFCLLNSRLPVLVLLRAWAIWGCQRRVAMMLIGSYSVYFLFFLVKATSDMMSLTGESIQSPLSCISMIPLFASFGVQVCTSP